MWPSDKSASSVTDNEDKTAFAAELLKTPNDPFKAALAIFDPDTGRALRAAHEWPKDPFVIAEQTRLSAERGELSFLPTKADLARSLWERAHANTTTNDDFTKMARLYADIMDYVPKVAKVDLTNNGKNSAIVQIVASPLDELL
jgi:hypothetical protein